MSSNTGSNTDDTKTLDQEVDEVLRTVDETDPVNDGEPPPVPKAEMDLRVAAVIPMHQAGTIQIKRRPGRPKKVVAQPSTDDLTYHAEMARQQVHYVEADAIVRATQARKDSAETLHLCKERLARVAAALEFRRIEDEKTGGKDSAQILSRQTAVLREIAQIELKIREMGVQLLDLRGEPMQKVFTLLVGRMQAVAAEVLPKAQFDLFFNRLETALDGWEEEAEGLIR